MSCFNILDCQTPFLCYAKLLSTVFSSMIRELMECFLCSVHVGEIYQISFSFKIPSPTPQEQGTKFGNQGKGNLKDKISSITLIPKLNTCQGNLKDKIPSIAFIPKLNPGQGNLKDKISSTALIPKLNIGQGNKLPSQRIDKRMLALPSLKITRFADCFLYLLLYPWFC